jgi:hypothetical protein
MNGDGVRENVFAEAFNGLETVTDLSAFEEVSRRYFKIYINLSKRNPQMKLA